MVTSFVHFLLIAQVIQTFSSIYQDLNKKPLSYIRQLRQHLRDNCITK